jgi:hypothetical protein
MADTAENLNLLAKEVFGKDGVPDLCPNGVYLQKEVTFDESEAMGLKFAQTVRLSYPNGFTNAKGDGTAGVFAFNNAKPGAQGRAELLGYQTLLRDQMSYEDAAKLQKGGAQSFAKGIPFFTDGLQKSMRKRIEAMLLHGGQGIGKITGSPSTVHTSNKLITIQTSEWAPFIWAGNEGMEIDAYNGASQINTNAPLVLVTSDPVARTIEVSGNATDLGNLATTHTLYYRGNYGAEMTGVHGILSNTGSLFNIDAGTYSMWKGTQYAPTTAGKLTFDKVKKAIAISVSRGLDEDCTLLVHPSTWDDLSTDIAALRKTDEKDVKKVDIGTEEIVYHSQNGLTKVVASGFMKEGYAYGLCNPKAYWKRLGAADVSFTIPGMGSDQMFFNLPSNAGVEFRAYTHQAILCLAPAKQFLISNIVNSTY